MSDIADSTVVVVGGTSGIGLATAAQAARRGARVHVAGRNVTAVTAALGDSVCVHRLDITDEAQIQTVIADIGAIDHLVVTAGSGRYGPVRELPREEAREFLDVKLWGQYSMVRAVADRLSPTGSIVLLSGIASRRPSAGLSLMSATNAAVEALGRGLALELAPVRVNVVAPGLVDTPIYIGMSEQARHTMYDNWSASVPAGRTGRPTEIADAICYLLTNEFITGTVLDIDGGGLIS